MSEQLMRALAKSKGKKKIKSNGRLAVFSNGEAMKLAQKLYFGYISQNDVSGFPIFLMRLDAMMAKERKICRDPIDLNPKDEEDENYDENEDVEGEDEEDDTPASRARRYRTSRKRDKEAYGDDDDDEYEDDDSEEIKIPKAAQKLARKIVESGLDVALAASSGIRSSRKLKISDIADVSEEAAAFMKKLVANSYGKSGDKSHIFGRIDPLAISISAPNSRSGAVALAKKFAETGNFKVGFGKDAHHKDTSVAMVRVPDGILYVAQYEPSTSERIIANISFIKDDSNDAYLASVTDTRFDRALFNKFAEKNGVKLQDGEQATASLADYEKYNQMSPRRNRAFNPDKLSEGLQAFFQFALRYAGEEPTVGMFTDTETGPRFTAYPNISKTRAILATNPLELAVVTDLPESSVFRLLARFVSQNKGWETVQSRAKNKDKNNSYITYALKGPNSALLVQTWKYEAGVALRVVEIDSTVNPALLKKRIAGFSMTFFKQVLKELDPNVTDEPSDDYDDKEVNIEDEGEDLYDDDGETDGDSDYDADLETDEDEDDLYDDEDDDSAPEADDDEDDLFDEADEDYVPTSDDDEEDFDEDGLSDETGDTDSENAEKFVESFKLKGVMVALDSAQDNVAVLTAMKSDTDLRQHAGEILKQVEAVLGKPTSYFMSKSKSIVRMVYGSNMVDIHLATAQMATLSFFQNYQKDSTNGLVDELRDDGVEIDDEELDEQPTEKSVARMMKAVASEVSSLRPFCET